MRQWRELVAHDRNSILILYPVGNTAGTCHQRYADAVKNSRLLQQRWFAETIAALSGLTMPALAHIRPPLFPGRLTVRLRTLTPSIEVRILTGEPLTVLCSKRTTRCLEAIIQHHHANAYNAQRRAKTLVLPEPNAMTL